MAEGKVRVTFFTHSELEREGIYRHVGRYKQGAYRASTQQSMIAAGPGGYIFLVRKQGKVLRVPYWPLQSLISVHSSVPTPRRSILASCYAR